MKRNLHLLLFATLLSVAALTFLAPKTTQAVTGADFQAGRIMDDGVFFNSNTMDVGTIQNFLNSKVPVCDTNGTQPYAGTTRAAYSAARGHPTPFICLKDYRQDTPNKPAETGLCNGYSGGNKSSAQIIYDVSQACGINPKVLIVLLEKEQSLVTDDWPWETPQYRSATGYGCPDTAACDSTYYGFFNQVYSAARQFKRYARDASNYGYRAARNNYIQYNPNAACGGTNVYIQNQATAGLYNYTPYQPNASALNNLYGSGDGCGAYGNRNFWRLYSDWFGSVYGAINITESPASASWGVGRIDTFSRGADGALWQRTYDFATGGWKPWARLGGVNVSTPSVVSMSSGRLDVYTKGPGGDLYHYWYGNGSWQNWESLGEPAPGVSLVSSPSVVSWEDGRMDIFALGSDGAIWQKWYAANLGGWKPWARLGGNVASAPTVASWGKDRIDLFAKGPGGDLHHFWYADGWKIWESLGEPVRGGVSLISAPGAVSWDSGRIDIFGRGSDGVMWQKWYDVSAGGWKPWSRFGGAIDSAPSVSSWDKGRLDIFSKGPHGNLQHYWHGTQGWGGFWDSLGRPSE